MIEVRLFAYFREGRGKVVFMSAENVSTCSDVLAQLSISEKDVAIFLINGFHAKFADGVKDNDILAIFPPVAGG